MTREYPQELHAIWNATMADASVTPSELIMEAMRRAQVAVIAPCVEIEAGIREAVRVMDLMGRGGDARAHARNGHNLACVIRKVTE